MRQLILAFTISLAVTAAQAAPKTVTGIPVVEDGDTITVNGIRIYLYNIDAPELGQKCFDESKGEYDGGEAAKQALIRLISNSPVECAYVHQDVRGQGKLVNQKTIVMESYPMNTGMCKTTTGKNLSLEMIKTGMVFFQIYRTKQFGLPRGGLIKIQQDHETSGRGIFNRSGKLRKCGPPEFEPNRKYDPRP